MSQKCVLRVEDHENACPIHVIFTNLKFSGWQVWVKHIAVQGCAVLTYFQKDSLSTTTINL